MYPVLWSGTLILSAHFSALRSACQPAASERSRQPLATWSGRPRLAEPCSTRLRPQNQQRRNGRPTGKSQAYSYAPLTAPSTHSYSPASFLQRLQGQSGGFLTLCHAAMFPNQFGNNSRIFREYPATVSCKPDNRVNPRVGGLHRGSVYLRLDARRLRNFQHRPDDNHPAPGECGTYCVAGLLYLRGCPVIPHAGAEPVAPC
jgi:hypothetical protein